MRIKNSSKKNPNLPAAALMTGSGAAAISKIRLFGSGAGAILKKVFRSKLPAIFSVGSIMYGFITDGRSDIDEVLVGCEGENNFGINCHGNPLLVEDILLLLQKNGADIVSPQQMLVLLAGQNCSGNTIDAESEITFCRSQTLEGAEIIAERRIKKFLMASRPADIKNKAGQILSDSKTADYFINGAKIVIAGLPNSGKSTLFNFLCGRQRAIVSEIAGTTRDWLGARIRLKRIAAEIFDTAGLDANLSLGSEIDFQSQQITQRLVKECDIILNIVDSAERRKFLFSDDREIVVFNKCDLPAAPADGLAISAKTGQGVEQLLDAVERKLGVLEFDFDRPVCFTCRQRAVFEEIAQTTDGECLKVLIAELLNGQINV